MLSFSQSSFGVMMQYFDWTVLDKIRGGLLCQCKCGNKQCIAANKLKNGKSRKCRFCSNQEKARNNIIHGCASRKDKRKRIYNIYYGILYRCYDSRCPDYHLYGAKGIKMCTRWRESFLNFLEDMGHPPSSSYIDRIDNDKDYEPNNCRWATPLKSGQNTSRNVIYEYKGEKICQAELMRRLKVKSGSFRYWLKKLGLKETIQKFNG